MRELSLNGYIDEESWFGDEITPDSLHELLYGKDSAAADDVHIRLNSYGGSCNAATRMFDDIRAYPGSVKITVSGTAASAATVLCMAADRLEMTPGSLFMIHDPSTVAYGNERDMDEAKAVLRACKESILNMYGTRIRISRDDAADMMMKTSWMDANEAFEKGFVDGVTETPGQAAHGQHGKSGVPGYGKSRSSGLVRSEDQAFFCAANTAKYTAARLCGAAPGDRSRAGQPRAGFRHRHTARTSQILRRRLV